MFVKKIPGSFIISTHGKGLGLKMMNFATSPSHVIHTLEFTTATGDTTNGAYTKNTNLLDGTKLNAEADMDVEYYLKLTSSIYEHPIWPTHRFYEYIAFQNIVGRDPQVAKLEFKYEFDPISMRYSAKNHTITGFLVSLCAIIGGVFATISYLNIIATRLL
eukprot:TRINITY_DN13792_c0_g1_i2.p1 TRINITY_DN13792_c0_g1~~TRINITY_DN13792_c0_g1_i2.p1  ORF type:complete len:161 (+),score=18.45 TRINITY_DN13792_c0_g1_i2:72-554(+)